MTVPPVSVSMAWDVLHNLEAENCVYLYGGKSPSLYCQTSAIHGIDCSGFTKYVLARSTGQQLVVPDGSFDQYSWCAMVAKLNPVDYSGIGQYGQGRLFWAFYVNPSGIGHTWLVDGTIGRSLESHGHAGPSSRLWNDEVLMRIVTHCYELPRGE
jgi:hypothetical protein